jgi:serine protease Do
MLLVKRQRFRIHAMPPLWCRHLAGTASTLFTALALGVTSGCALRPVAQAASDAMVALVREAGPAVVGVGNGREVIGSGFRVAGTPWIVTAAHVARQLRTQPMITWKAVSWPVRLSTIDEATDLALMELDETVPLDGLKLPAADTIAAGQTIVVLGCPFGTLPTATAGMVSALPGALLQPPSLANQLELNAAINPGNSGGPIVDLQGRVVGVANATLSGGYGLGFAVPVDALRRLLARQTTISRTGRGNPG